MNLLLDTNIALWAITDDPTLGERARALIADRDNTIWVSAASLWEIATKHALRRTDMPISATAARTFFEDSGYRPLAIEPAHAVTLESLPAIHADPFDRILVSQAAAERFTLLTRDAVLPRYGTWVRAV